MFLSFLKGKSKILVGVVLITSLSALGMWWYTGNLQEQLGAIEAREDHLLQSLEDSEKANDVLWSEINRTNRIVEDTRQDRREIKNEMRKLKDVLSKEKQTNKALQDCLSVDLGEYADRLREQTASKDGSEKNSDP